MNDNLAPLLSTLPEPVVPSSITATVMARIEREVAARHAESVSPTIVRPRRDVSMAVLSCLGIALVCGATAMGWYSFGVPEVFAPRLFRGGLGSALTGWQASLLGIVGLILCLRALFAPLRSR